MFWAIFAAFARVSNTFSTLSKIAVYRSLSRRAGDSSGLAFVFSFRAFSFSCFEFVSDFDILNFVLPPSNYAKQTQFAKR